MDGNMNPIIKKETFKMTILSGAPFLPDYAALVLYPHGAREFAKVYFKEDTVFPAEIRKWHFNRLAHVALRQYTFYKSFKYSFSKDDNQWAEMTYKFTVAIKPDKDSVKSIIVKDITDITAPINELLNENGALKLNNVYKCTQSRVLEAAFTGRIADIAARIGYLDISIRLESMKFDKVSEKIISDFERNELAKADIRRIEDELSRQKDEAEVRRIEAAIAKVKAEKEEELAEIQRQKDILAHQYEVLKNTMDMDAQTKLSLLKAKNISKIADAQKDNLGRHDISILAAIDEDYQEYIDKQQEEIDRKRKNRNDDFDSQYNMFIKFKEAFGDIDQATFNEMVRREVLGVESNAKRAISSSTEINDVVVDIPENENISEDGNENV